MGTWGKLGLFAGGLLFGTAGLKILSSKDAKKLYTHTTAAVLRAKECVMNDRDHGQGERRRHTRRREEDQRGERRRSSRDSRGRFGRGSVLLLL